MFKGEEMRLFKTAIPKFIVLIAIGASCNTVRADWGDPPPPLPPGCCTPCPTPTPSPGWGGVWSDDVGDILLPILTDPESGK